MSKDRLRISSIPFSNPEITLRIMGVLLALSSLVTPAFPSTAHAEAGKGKPSTEQAAQPPLQNRESQAQTLLNEPDSERKPTLLMNVSQPPKFFPDGSVVQVDQNIEHLITQMSAEQISALPIATVVDDTATVTMTAADASSSAMAFSTANQDTIAYLESRPHGQLILSLGDIGNESFCYGTLIVGPNQPNRCTLGFSDSDHPGYIRTIELATGAEGDDLYTVHIRASMPEGNSQTDLLLVDPEGPTTLVATSMRFNSTNPGEIVDFELDVNAPEAGKRFYLQLQRASGEPVTIISAELRLARQLFLPLAERGLSIPQNLEEGYEGQWVNQNEAGEAQKQIAISKHLKLDAISVFGNSETSNGVLQVFLKYPSPSTADHIAQWENGELAYVIELPEGSNQEHADAQKVMYGGAVLVATSTIPFWETAALIGETVIGGVKVVLVGASSASVVPWVIAGGAVALSLYRLQLPESYPAGVQTLQLGDNTVHVTLSNLYQANSAPGQELVATFGAPAHSRPDEIIAAGTDTQGQIFRLSTADPLSDPNTVAVLPAPTAVTMAATMLANGLIDCPAQSSQVCGVLTLSPSELELLHENPTVDVTLTPPVIGTPHDLAIQGGVLRPVIADGTSRGFDLSAPESDSARNVPWTMLDLPELSVSVAPAVMGKNNVRAVLAPKSGELDKPLSLVPDTQISLAQRRTSVGLVRFNNGIDFAVIPSLEVIAGQTVLATSPTFMALSTTLEALKEGNQPIAQEEVQEIIDETERYLSQQYEEHDNPRPLMPPIAVERDDKSPSCSDSISLSLSAPKHLNDIFGDLVIFSGWDAAAKLVNYVRDAINQGVKVWEGYDRQFPDIRHVGDQAAAVLNFGDYRPRIVTSQNPYVRRQAGEPGYMDVQYLSFHFVCVAAPDSPQKVEWQLSHVGVFDPNLNGTPNNLPNQFPFTYLGNPTGPIE